MRLGLLFTDSLQETLDHPEYGLLQRLQVFIDHYPHKLEINVTGESDHCRVQVSQRDGIPKNAVTQSWMQSPVRHHIHLAAEQFADVHEQSP